ncbi:unnamed protein product [Lactuca saligna]|uniref:Exocyst subunit Exo70 family protein n=1 Tax=Lactuca saligna TaxID=75948 RepID=A0AA35VTD8_LACSI|nr:unnamed protein product [Lactuca saligna]
MYSEMSTSSPLPKTLSPLINYGINLRGKACKDIRESVVGLTKRLAQTAQETFGDFEEAVEKDATKTVVSDGTFHPLTSYVINSVKFLFEYVKFRFYPYQIYTIRNLKRNTFLHNLKLVQLAVDIEAIDDQSEALEIEITPAPNAILSPESINNLECAGDYIKSSLKQTDRKEAGDGDGSVILSSYDSGLINWFNIILCLKMHWILFGLLIQILCDSVLWPIVVHWNRILLIFQKIKQRNIVRKSLYFSSDGYCKWWRLAKGSLSKRCCI